MLTKLHHRMEQQLIPKFVLLGTILAAAQSAQAQYPISVIEGFLEVYPVGDTTSIYIGVDAGQKTTGIINCNTFVGAHAGLETRSGFWNSFFGEDAGRNTTTGELDKLETQLKF